MNTAAGKTTETKTKIFEIDGAGRAERARGRKVHNHSARVVVIDEIWDANEVEAARTMTNHRVESPPQSLEARHIIAGHRCHLYAGTRHMAWQIHARRANVRHAIHASSKRKTCNTR